MTEADIKIIDKIKKLLALANSSNEYEAKLAADKAAEILTTYNLTLGQVLDYSPSNYECQETEGTPQMKVQDKFVLSILQDFYFVKILHHREHQNRKTSFKFVGKPVNVSTAIFVYYFLSEKYHTLWLNYSIRNKSQKAARQSYFHGLTCGLSQQLESSKKRVESSTGLTIIKDFNLEKYVKEDMKITGHIRHKGHSNDVDAFVTGVKEGVKLQIARGLETTTTQSGRYLSGPSQK